MTAGQALREVTSQPALGQRRSVWPRAAVAATVAWNLWQVRATVAVAAPDNAFRWSLYLLWCLWPAAIYASARVLGLRPQAAACAAVVAPLLHSAPGVGYEQHAYLQSGYGTWAQLWGAWGLPFAWAFTWRAMTSRRFLAPAAAAVALTAAFHYETGYLAFLAIVIMPFLVLEDLSGRLRRAAVLLASSAAASAWVMVPLLKSGRQAVVGQATDGYGARQGLDWLVTGRLFDDGHLPVISLLVAAGLAGALARWRRPAADPGPYPAPDPPSAPAQVPAPGRALVALLGAALVLSCGRTTFGGLTAVLPGAAGLLFGRFMVGAQLAGIYLAGLGAMEAAAAAPRLAAAAGRFFDLDPAHRDWTRSPWPRWATATVLAVAAVAYLYPAWHDDGDIAAANARAAAPPAGAPPAGAIPSGYPWLLTLTAATLIVVYVLNRKSDPDA